MRIEHDGYGTADLHMHSDHSDGMAAVPEILDHIEHTTNLDVIAITDHDTLEGSEAARNRAAQRRYSFEVVMGAEITTVEGHLLALFIEKPVKSLQPVLNTVEAIHDQGGLCIVPHPMSWLTRSIGEATLDKVMAHRDPTLNFDGIELYNPTLAARVVQRKTRKLNRRRYHLAETGSSDSHFLPTIGAGYTIFSGRTATELRADLEQRRTTAGGFQEPTISEIGYGEIVKQQLRSLLMLPTRRITASAGRLLEQHRARQQ